MSQVSVVYPKKIPFMKMRHHHVFLAGPIRNAPPWHEDAIHTIELLMDIAGDTPTLVYSPKRKANMGQGMVADEVFYCAPSTFLEYARQRQWEFVAQELAVHSAGLLFWLPKQGSNEHPEKVYGAITQVEFGYWTARASVDKNLRIAFGTDGVYNNELRTLLYDIERLCPHLLPMHTSLQSLCAQSVKWASEPLP